MTKLLHLAAFPNPHPGSFVPVLLTLLGKARERGWDAQIALPEAARRIPWVEEFGRRGIPVTFLPDSGRSDITRAVGELIGTTSEPTVVHTHFTSYDIPAALAKRRQHGDGRFLLFWHIHTVLGTSPLAVARNSAKFALFGATVDRVVVPAANIGEGLIRRRAPRDKMMLMPSAIDAQAYVPPTAEERHAAREALGIRDGSAMLLHMGRAWKLKGGPTFLRAAKQLIDDGLDVTAVTLRGGEEAQRDAEQLGIADRTVVTGLVEDVRDLYAAADCFVAPSRGEGMPFSVVEALGSGIPVVASDLPGHRYLADEVAACVVAPAEPGPTAAAVAAFLHRPPEQVISDAAVAREWIIENLSLDAVAEHMLDTYAEMLASPTPIPSGF